MIRQIVTGVLFSIMLLAVGVTGCKTLARPTVVQGLVENRSSDEIRMVKVLHLPTRMGAEISAIGHDRVAAVAFTPKVMEADEALLIWTEKNVKRTVRLKLPAATPDGKTGMNVLLYRIYDRGRATVQIVPVEMSR